MDSTNRASEALAASSTEEVLAYWWVSYPTSSASDEATVVDRHGGVLGAPPVLPLVFGFDTKFIRNLYSNCPPSELAGREYLDLALARDDPPDDERYLKQLWDIVSPGDEPVPSGAAGRVLATDDLNTGGGLSFVPKYLLELFPVENGMIPTVRMARYRGDESDALKALTVSLPTPSVAGGSRAYVLSRPPYPVWIVFEAAERWFEYLASPSFHPKTLDEGSLVTTLQVVTRVVESKKIPKPKRVGSVGYLLDMDRCGINESSTP